MAEPSTTAAEAVLSRAATMLAPSEGVNVEAGGTAGDRPKQPIVDNLQIPIDFVNDLASARSQEETLARFASWAHYIVGADRCSVAVPDGDVLIVRSLAGNSAIPPASKLPIAATFIGRVFSTKSADILTDLGAQPFPDAQKLHAAGMRTLMISPLLAGGRCVGTLAFAFRDERERDCACFPVIKTLAGCLALQLLVLEQIRELADLVRIDPLTKTFNRRHFDETMRGIWERWVAERVSFALVAVDIDHFKAINDTYGHHTGDAVLKAVAERLNTGIAADHAVVRMGGEEFALILAQRGAEDAETIARTAHHALRSTPFHIADKSLTVTASFGVAVAADGDDCPMAVYRRADRALYAAKSSGRDRVLFGALPSA